MNLSLEGRSALVCGSTQGIGRAAAHELALLGARIVLLARNEASLAATAAALPAVKSGPHTFLAADFSDPATVDAAAHKATGAGEPLHILVNNTGGPPGGPLQSASPEALLAAFHAHVICNQLLTRALVPGMKAAGFGRIINVISTSVKAPIPNLGVSNTIRGAVASWAKTLATELGASGITVNNVLPGYTSTERLASLTRTRAQASGASLDSVEADLKASIPAARFGTPQEIGAAIAFLASPAAAYINGINLPVDGGRLPTL